MPRDRAFNRFLRVPRKRPQDNERDKGAALPPLPLGSEGAAGTGGGAFLGWLRSGWSAFWLSPHVSWSGAVLGSLLALMGSLYGAYHLWNYKAAASGAAEPVPFPFRWTYPEGDVERPPVESLLRGFKALFGDPGDPRDAPADGEMEYPAADGIPIPAGVPAAASGGEPGGETAAEAAENAEAAAGPQLAKAPGAGILSAGSGAGTVGGAGAVRTELGTPLEGSAVSGGAKGALADRTKRAAAPSRSLGGARGKPGSLNALRQLKMSQKLSKEASYSPKTGQAYETAGAAFGGGTSGTPIEGVGAGDSGGGIGESGGGQTEQAAATKICPSGYLMTGDSCVPVDYENQTPYQDLVDMARMFVAGAAICALLGLFLLTRAGNPALQILGGILLGIAAALVLAAVAIGNRIQDQYDQAAQNQAIQGSGADALQGDSP